MKGKQKEQGEKQKNKSEKLSLSQHPNNFCFKVSKQTHFFIEK